MWQPSGGRFASYWFSLSSGFPPKTKGQVERFNQDLETPLRAMCSRILGTWASHLWIKYVHNLLYRVLSFPSGLWIATPSLSTSGAVYLYFWSAGLVRRCHQVWRQYRTLLICDQERLSLITNHHLTRLLCTTDVAFLCQPFP